jgi:hypothetical protein
VSPEAAAPGIAAGARIANARGVPGTVACAVGAPGEGPMLLTGHHVLFGAGGVPREPVWLVGGGEEAPEFRRVGTTLRGHLGTVEFDGASYHVDCALVGLARPARRRARFGLPPARLRAGDHVFKLGGATGATAGVVVATDHPAVTELDGRTHPAPRQILVRPRDGEGPLSGPGDSGAALRDADGAVVGLLWGVTDRGESLACHIAPVLACLAVSAVAPRRHRRPVAEVVA